MLPFPLPAYLPYLPTYYTWAVVLRTNKRDGRWLQSPIEFPRNPLAPKGRRLGGGL